jgi:hypothetical protein
MRWKSAQNGLMVGNQYPEARSILKKMIGEFVAFFQFVTTSYVPVLWNISLKGAFRCQKHRFKAEK